MQKFWKKFEKKLTKYFNANQFGDFLKISYLLVYSYNYSQF